MLFNKNDLFESEISELLGFVDAASRFKKWETWLELSERQVTNLVGRAVWKRAEEFYMSEEFDPNGDTVDNKLLKRLRLPNALFAFVKMIPSLDANHGNNGRIRTVGTTEKTLTAAEAYKDEANILSLAYEAMEHLLLFLEENSIKEWIESTNKKELNRLLLPSKELFEAYYPINSSRLFYTIVPMMKEVQDSQIIPAITQERYVAIINAQNSQSKTQEEERLMDLLNNYIRRPLAIGTMLLALERLPIHVLPEGVVQTHIAGTIKEKHKADQQAVKSLIANLKKTMDLYMNNLANQIELLSGTKATDLYIATPKNEKRIKGFLF